MMAHCTPKASPGIFVRSSACRLGARSTLSEQIKNAIEQQLTMNSRFAAERYDVIPLPFIPFSNTGGEALSNNGVVAGGIANSDGSVSLAEWSKGVLTNLGVPPGLPSHDFNLPRVFGVNDYGAVVGTIHTSAGYLPSRSF